MKYELVWDSTFEKKLNKVLSKYPEQRILFQRKFQLLSQEPYHNSLKTHKLQGKLKSCYSSSLTTSLRIVFKFVEDKKILLVDIGTHDEVY